MGRDRVRTGARRSSRANFDERGEVGAAVSVYLDGEPVVDLWGGVADRDNRRAVDDDTIVLVYSSTKGVTAVCANLLIDRGLLDPEATVASIWPEFAANGKDRHHRRAGDVAPGRPAVRRGRLHARPKRSTWNTMVDALARQKPIWEPGTKHGYHMRTYGWLVGRDHSPGRSAATARPARCASRSRATRSVSTSGSGCPNPRKPASRDSCRRSNDLREALEGRSVTTCCSRASSPTRAVTSTTTTMWNTRQLHAAELPSSNGIGDARGLARLYASCIGEIDGRRTLNAATLACAHSHVRACGKDEVLMIESCFGLGFMLGNVRSAPPIRPTCRRSCAERAVRSRSPIPTATRVRVRDERPALRCRTATRGSEELVRAVYRCARARELIEGERAVDARFFGQDRARVSPTMLRWISSVPPRIDIDGAVRNSVCHSPSGRARASAPRMRVAERGVSRNSSAPRSFIPEPSGTGPTGARRVACPRVRCIS